MPAARRLPLAHNAAAGGGSGTSPVSSDRRLRQNGVNTRYAASCWVAMRHGSHHSAALKLRTGTSCSCGAALIAVSRAIAAGS